MSLGASLYFHLFLKNWGQLVLISLATLGVNSLQNKNSVLCTTILEWTSTLRFENTFTDLFLLDSQSNLMSWHCQNLVHKTKLNQLKTPQPSWRFMVKVKSPRDQDRDLDVSFGHFCSMTLRVLGRANVQGKERNERHLQPPLRGWCAVAGFPLLVVFWVVLGIEPRDSVHAG